MSWIAAAAKVVEYIDLADSIVEELPKAVEKIKKPKLPKIFGLDFSVALTLVTSALLYIAAVLSRIVNGTLDGFTVRFGGSLSDEDMKKLGKPSTIVGSTSYDKQESSTSLTIAGLVLGHEAYVTSKWGATRPGHSHAGWDLRAKTGSPVYAPFDAKIVRVVNYLDGDAGGLRILMQSMDGRYGVYVMHLNSIGVQKGDLVKKGQQIATSGGSGGSSMTRYAPHIHMEVGRFINGRFVHEDPAHFHYDEGYEPSSSKTAVNVATLTVTTVSPASDITVMRRLKEMDALYPGRKYGYGEFMRASKTATVHDTIEEAKNVKVSSSLKKKIVYIFRRWTGAEFNLNAYQVAGIIGNLWQESSLNEYTNAKGSSGKVVAKGIACWESWAWKTYKSRYGVELASERDTFTNQVSFLTSELHRKDKALYLLRESKNIEQATSIFCTEYEGASKPNLLRRIKLAYRAYMIYAENAEQSQAINVYINNEAHMHHTINDYLRQ